MQPQEDETLAMVHTEIAQRCLVVLTVGPVLEHDSGAAITDIDARQ